MIDLHIHTSFSPDSKTSMERACAVAYARGLKVIGFSDHAEFVNEDSAYIVDNYDAWGIQKEIAVLREAYANKMEILFGVEVGFIPGMESDIKTFLSAHPFDYAIGSIHYVDGRLVSAWIREREEAEAGFMPYFKALLGAAGSGLFQVLGHLDYVRKYMFAPQNYRREEYSKIIDEVLETAVSSELTIEINCSGWRHFTREPYPGEDYLKRFAKKGGSLTIGSDAHKYTEIGYANLAARQLLKEVGFETVRIFRKRKSQDIGLFETL